MYIFSRCSLDSLYDNTPQRSNILAKNNTNMAARQPHNPIEICSVRKMPGSWTSFRVSFDADKETILIFDERGLRRFDARVIQFLLIAFRDIQFGAINESRENVEDRDMKDDLLLEATNTYAAKLGQPKEADFDIYDVKMLVDKTFTNAIARKENRQLDRLFICPSSKVQVSMLNEGRYYFARGLAIHFSDYGWWNEPPARGDASSIIYHPSTHTVTLIDRGTISSPKVPPKKLELDGSLYHALLLGARHGGSDENARIEITSLAWIVFKTVQRYSIVHRLRGADKLDFDSAKVLIGKGHRSAVNLQIENIIIREGDKRDERLIMYELVRWYGERQSVMMQDLISIFDSMKRRGEWKEELEAEKPIEESYNQEYHRINWPKNRTRQYVPKQTVTKVERLWKYRLERGFRTRVG